MSLKKNIPFSQFLRIKCNCTQSQDFWEASLKMRNRFIERGYLRTTVEESLQRTGKISREQLLTVKSKSSTQNISFSLQYSPLAARIKNVIFKHWHVLSNVPECAEKPFVGMRRTKSLKDALVHTDVIRPEVRQSNLPVGNHKCGHCAACKLFTECKEFVYPIINQKYIFKHFWNCASKFCVYVISCLCPLIYVGSSSRSVKVLILEHVNRIRNSIMEAPLTQHFTEKGHDPLSLRFCVIEQIQSTTDKDRVRLLHQRETFWIHKLNSVQPSGLNEKIEFGYFL